MTYSWPLGLLLCSCLLWTMVTGWHSSPRFMVLFGRSARSDSTMGVGVFFTGLKSPVNLHLDLMDYDGLRLQEGETFLINPEDGFKVLNFKFSDKLRRPYTLMYLRVTAWGGASFEYFRQLIWRNRRITAFIQLDRKTYKPGQTVKFRALAMFPDTTVADEEMKITITDPLSNLVASWTRKKGSGKSAVMEGQMSTPTEPRLGEYCIKASVKGASKLKYFTIENYDSPDFELLLWIARASSTDTKVKARIFAKYLIGTPTSGSGKLVVQVASNYYYYSRYYRNEKLEKQFTLDKNGAAVVTFKMTEIQELICKSYYYYYWYYWYYRYYCYRSNYFLRYRSLRFKAEVKDDNSHQVVRKSKDIWITAYKTYLTTIPPTPYAFKPGLPLNVFVQDRRSNGRPNKKPRQSYLTYTVKYRNATNCRWWYSTWHTFLQENVTLDYLSTAELEISAVPADACYLRVEATNGKFTTYRYFYRYYSTSGTYLHLELNKDLIIDKTRKITVKSNKDIGNYTVQIYSKGVLVSAWRETPKTVGPEQLFKFDVNWMFPPVCHMVVYYPTERGEIVADGLSLPVEYLSHKVTLKIDGKLIVTRKPNEKKNKVIIRVNGEENTMVFVMGKDNRTLTKPNDIKAEDVVKAQMTYDASRYHGYYNYESRVYDMFRNTGLGMVTNFNVPGRYYYYYYYVPRTYRYSRYYYYYYRRYYYGCHRFGSIPSPPVRFHYTVPLTPAEQVEKYLPDTFLWKSVKIGESLTRTIKFVAPDTLASWNFTAFAVHPDKGLILVEPLQLTTAKKMFVTMYLPKSAIRGEVVCLKAIAHNTDVQNHTAEMKIKKNTDFEVVQIEKNGNATEEIYSSINWIKDLGLVEAGIMEAATFCIKPLVLGDVKVEVKASVDNSQDDLKRTIHIKSEGIPRSQVFPFLVEIEPSGSYSKSVDISLPDNVVDNSYRLSVTVAGARVMMSAEKLGDPMETPYGCGEENLKHMALNTYIIDYLEKTRRLSNDIKKSAKDMIQTGYHQEMNYQRYDGSFSAFGNRDSYGSTWLTAHVIKTFIHATNLASSSITVEPDILGRAVGCLTEYQNSDGSYWEMGRVVHKAIQGDSATNRLRLTAYVVTALAEAKKTLRGMWQNVASARAESALSKAVGFLEDNMATDDPYTSCILAYALVLAKSDKADEAVQSMNNTATTNGDLKYWTGESKGVDIEMSSYALLALVQKKWTDDSIAVFRWLNKQTDAQGEFPSHQGMIMGVQALSAMTRTALKNSFTDIKVKVTVARAVGDVEKSNTVTVTPDNAGKLQRPNYRWPVEKAPGSITVEGTTTSTTEWLFAYAEVRVDYNVKSVPASGGELSVDVTVSSISTRSFQLETCVQRQSTPSYTDNPMIVAEIFMPTGYGLNKTNAKYGWLSKARLDRKQGKVTLYYLWLGKSCSTLRFDMVRGNVAYVQSPRIHVYNKFKDGEEVTVMYNVTGSNTCDVTDGYDDSC